MDDKLIIDLFWNRNEDAITETQEKYGKYCFSIAFNILKSDSDAEECVNDTYMNAWNSIPPTRPNVLSLFLGKITRNLSLNKYYHNRAVKRTTVIEETLDEVADFISSDGNFDTISEELVLKDVINRFLASLNKQNRIVFVRRYWYLSSVKEIANSCGLSETNVKVKLTRLRKSFKTFIEKEGIHI
ncbi:MAG: sigma-70 family RNA polymerase sigma factor [Clostridia bacterium]|nr:sigma-70 family RNA polymerase sigma factor [Clostridia bacterium]